MLIPSFLIEAKHKQVTFPPAPVKYEQGLLVKHILPHNEIDWGSGPYYIFIQGITIYNFPFDISGYPANAFTIQTNWTKESVLQTFYCQKEVKSTQAMHFNFANSNILHVITDPSPILKIWISPIWDVYVNADPSKTLVSYDRISLSFTIQIFKAINK